MTTVHAELTLDGKQLILLAAGLDVYEIARAAQALKALTPLFKPSDPEGALLVPATWPAVVQLSATFGDHFVPGPLLCEWIAGEVSRRTASLDLESAAADYVRAQVPAGRRARDYQVLGAMEIARTGRSLIFDEPRTGKTITTILGLVVRYRTAPAETLPIVVVCPASVVDAWVEEFDRWAPYLRTVAWRGPKRDELYGSADVYVTSYDTARVDAAEVSTARGKAPLIALGARSVVVDECFPTGTLVETPDGPRPIENLRVGDKVVGVDHTTGAPVVTTVRHVFERTTDEDLVSVNGVEMTPNHPVWTTRGYVPAATVRRTDEVCSTLINFHHGDVHADLRMVRADVHEDGQAQRPAPVLRQELLSEVAHVRPGVRRLTGHPEATGVVVGQPAAMARESGGQGPTGGAPERPGQPSARPRRAGEGSGDASGTGLPDAQWWEWSADSAAEVAGRSAWVVNGGLDQDWSEGAVPARVQGRPGLTGANDRDRGRRGEPQELEVQVGGRSAGRAARRARLDRAAVLEPTGARRDRVGDGSDHGGRRVFNIETGTGNYVAGGLLVHNCHFIKNPTAHRTRAVRRLARRATGAFVGLSGTPITHHPADLWPVLSCLSDAAWPARERWVARYCHVVPGDYDDQILGLHPYTEPEFRLAIAGQHRRVARADVMSQLPPKTFSVRTVDLPATWRKAYDDFEAQMLAELPGEDGAQGQELSVMDTLPMLGHLFGLASSAADVRVEYGPDVDKATGEPKRHVHLDLKAPSWKVDALLEILGERPGESVLAFSPSAQLMRLAGAAATAAGRRVGYVIGGQAAGERTAAIKAFQAGELDLICATTGAGGTGITLSRAGTLVFLQRPWSIVESLQAEDRAEGDLEATRGTEIIDVVARDTIDSRVRAVLRTRAGQLSDLVQDRRIVEQLLGGRNVVEHQAQPELVPV